MAKLPEYQARAESVKRLIGNRRILNVCGELNVNSNHRVEVSQRYNQTVFGAAYYASALLCLIRGGADVEMWWTATDSTGPFGIMDELGRPTPAFLAKKLFTHHVSYGDRIGFPRVSPEWAIDAALVHGQHGDTSIVLVHLSEEERACDLSDLKNIGDPSRFTVVHRIDQETGNQIVSGPFDGSVTFCGYGVAIATTATDFPL
jgi:hypothetical protein